MTAVPLLLESGDQGHEFQRINPTNIVIIARTQVCIVANGLARPSSEIFLLEHTQKRDE